MSDTRIYALNLGVPLKLKWAVFHLRNCDWECRTDTFSDKRDIVDDIKVIESTLSDHFPLLYHWRNGGYTPSYIFCKEEEMIFKLQFCGEEVDWEYLSE
ncbi:hypothetical protein D3C87_588120 [compost metagenome]